MQSNMTLQKNLLLLIVVLFWFAQYVYVPFQTPYLLAAQVSSGTVGIIIGVYGFSQMILRMPVGIMADLNGKHKLFIITGVAASALASVFRILLPPQEGFLIGNILSGFASAMWISFMVLYASYFSKNKMQKAMGLILAANNIGILGGFVLSTILYNEFGMNFICMLSVGSGIPALILSFFIKNDNKEINKSKKTASPTLRSLVKVYIDKRLILFSLLILIQLVVLMATCMSFTAQVAHELNASANQIGLLSIVYIISAVLSSYFAALEFAQRQGAGFWIPVIMFLLALYCFIVPNAASPNILIISQILAGLSTGILFSFCTTEALKNVPLEKRSTAMGYFQAIYAVGMTVIPMFAGAVSEKYGLSTAFYIEGITALLATLAAIIFFVRKKSKQIN